MDIRFTPEQEAFRQQVREFLRRELPADWPYRLWQGGDGGFSRLFLRRFASSGLLTSGWPVEYGGQGRTFIEQVIQSEELYYHQAPYAYNAAVSFVGPTLMLHGSPAQRQEWLPPIARGEITFCQGFSEPEAGSDLASVRTRAVEDGDDFVVTGSKIWTGGAHQDDFCWLLARTDPDAPKHKGLSLFIMDMHSPGITVRPIIDISGRHELNQVFLDGVRIPRRNLVGEKNRGWYIAMTTLEYERSGIGRPASAKRVLEETVAFARGRRWNGQPLTRYGPVRNRLAELAVEIEVGRWLAYRIGWLQTTGQPVGHLASISKVYGSELVQRTCTTALQVLGAYGQLMPGEARAPAGGTLPVQWLYNFSTTIESGTSEIQRLIIATRGLGLPRG